MTPDNNKDNSMQHNKRNTTHAPTTAYYYSTTNYYYLVVVVVVNSGNIDKSVCIFGGYDQGGYVSNTSSMYFIEHCSTEEQVLEISFPFLFSAWFPKNW